MINSLQFHHESFILISYNISKIKIKVARILDKKKITRFVNVKVVDFLKTVTK